MPFSEILEDIKKDKTVAQLQTHEGLRLSLYLDSVGATTIGYGTNLSVGINQDEAALLMAYRLKTVSNELVVYIKSKGLTEGQEGWWTEARAAVLLNMAYNLGMPRLKTFVKFFASLKAEDAETAANEMLDSVWARQVGSRATELAEQMRTGEFQNLDN